LIDSFFKRHWLILLAMCIYAMIVGPLIPVGIDDIRMADVFSVDESGAAVVVRHQYASGSYDLVPFKYGSLFYFIPLSALHAFAWFWDVSDRAILTILRVFCSVSALACIGLAYALGRQLYGRIAGLVAAGMLLTSPAVVRWSVETHPDLPQLVLVTLFLWQSVRVLERYDLRGVCGSAILAALAFNVKYVGVFLIPTLLFSIVLPELVEKKGRLQDVAGEKWLGVLSSVLVFLVVIAATNPAAAADVTGFFDTLDAERSIMSFGHTFRQDGSQIRWLGFALTMFGWPNLVVLLASLTRRRWTWGTEDRIRLLMLFWCVTYFGYLLVASSLVRPRHLLPVFPAVAVLCGGAYVHLCSVLSERFGRHRRVACGVTVVFALALLSPLKTAARVVSEKGPEREDRDEIRAGRWLADNFSPEKSVLYDSYSYVPSSFQKTARTFGMTYMAIEHFRPSLLVVRDAIVQDYADTARASESRVGELAYMDSHYFYSYLREGRIPAYKLAKDFGSVAVFTSRDRMEERRMPWLQIIRSFGADRTLGVADARTQMAVRHREAGNTFEAARQRKLAETAGSTPAEKFVKAKAHLRRGEDGLAKVLFDDILTTNAPQADSFKAAIELRVARSYFETSYFYQAAHHADRAILLDDNLEAIHFELGAFLVAIGDTAKADSILSGAVRRFGKSSHGRSILEQMVDVGIMPDLARSTLVKHF